ncbi:helix-turn-helix domain-containing protein [Marinobacter psychrophilus]|jgi:transcriptional regulator with XRE-family HTH domain|uniref:helix-turn-helix domain-containing protein n=1 Tax=Marinobacter psychrophilus TaxID=330734 RepID=UPI000A046EC7|nr:helix-turn-helix domain-containing protein [Marinobacter psychrophilus]
MPKSIEAQTYQIRQVNDALKATGRLISIARKHRKWSQSQLGDRLGGVDRRHISAIEKGDPNAEFGLVVSAFWLLDIQALATLPPQRNQPLSDRIKSLLSVMDATNSDDTTLLRRTKRMLGSTNTEKKVVNNDF